MQSSSAKRSLRIALIGDYNPNVVAHQAIPIAITAAASALHIAAAYDWLATTELHSHSPLQPYDAIWAVPGSPYQNTEGALTAIRYARESNTPFLGTCGGFQHAILEYARNVLGWADASHAETDSSGRMVITALSCSLIEQTDQIELRPNSLIAQAHVQSLITEGYKCSYGLSKAFAHELTDADLQATGWDKNGDIRAVELVSHPFFVCTLFQHERAALTGQPTPLVRAMLKAASA